MLQILRSNKPDKINRNIVTLDGQSGGLNMVNVKLFIKCLKTTWLRRLLQQMDAPWNKLFQKAKYLAFSNHCIWSISVMYFYSKYFQPIITDIFMHILYNK